MENSGFFSDLKSYKEKIGWNEKDRYSHEKKDNGMRQKAKSKRKGLPETNTKLGNTNNEDDDQNEDNNNGEENKSQQTHVLLDERDLYDYLE